MEIIFKLVGPLLLVFGILTFFRQRKFMKESALTSGTIVEIRTGPASKNRVAYYPVFKYRDESTSTDEVYVSNISYERTKYKIGDPVEIRYLNSGGKKKATLNNWFGIWGLAFMLTLFGVIFSIITVLFSVKL